MCPLEYNTIRHHSLPRNVLCKCLLKKIYFTAYYDNRKLSIVFFYCHLAIYRFLLSALLTNKNNSSSVSLFNFACLQSTVKTKGNNSIL